MRVRALLPSDRVWEGEDVTLSLSPDDIHWFDVHSGDRISTHSTSEAGRIRQPLDMSVAINAIANQYCWR
jgi:hypothetical protein